jgi:hypothetical protein
MVLLGDGGEWGNVSEAYRRRRGGVEVVPACQGCNLFQSIESRFGPFPPNSYLRLISGPKSKGKVNGIGKRPSASVLTSNTGKKNLQVKRRSLEQKGDGVSFAKC